MTTPTPLVTSTTESHFGDDGRIEADDTLAFLINEEGNNANNNTTTTTSTLTNDGVEELTTP